MKSRNLVLKITHDVATLGTLIIALTCMYGVVTAPLDGSKTLLTALAFVWAILALICFVVLVAKREGDNPAKRFAQLLIDAA